MTYPFIRVSLGSLMKNYNWAYTPKKSISAQNTAQLVDGFRHVQQ